MFDGMVIASTFKINQQKNSQSNHAYKKQLALRIPGNMVLYQCGSIDMIQSQIAAALQNCNWKKKGIKLHWLIMYKSAVSMVIFINAEITHFLGKKEPNNQKPNPA